MSEEELRKIVAEEIEYKFLPLCICDRCDNVAIGTVIQNIINEIRGEN